MKENSFDKSNLYVLVGAFLLPLYLINAQRCWDQVIILILIEIVRSVSSSDVSKRHGRTTLLNFITANFRIFILILITLIAVTITKTDIFLSSNNIKDTYIGIPVILYYILSFIYNGGLNSETVENHNIKNLKSRNLLSYISIYKIIIPFVLISNAKDLLSKGSFDIYLLINELLFVSTLIVGFIFIWIYMRSSLRNIQLTAVQSITLLPISFIYLSANTISNKEYLLYLILNSFLFSFIVILENYQVKFKRTALWISKLLLFNSPISPLLFVNLYYLNNSKMVFNDLVTLSIFMIMIIPNLWLVSDLKVLRNIKIKKYNKHANLRLIFIVISTIIVMMNHKL
jgi:hypothetical protein